MDLSKLGGRKFLLALLTIAIVLLRDVLGIDTDQVEQIVKTAFIIAGAIAAEDAAKGLLKAPKRR